MNHKIKKVREIAPICISFIIVLILMYLLYRIFGYAPWGNRSLATDDGYWQYMDFFGYYKDVLAGKQKLSFSFSSGLGMPGLALFAYYLSSPFNLLVVFFSKENFHDFFDLVVALKLATAAGTSCFFLKKRFEDRVAPAAEVALAVSYALMQYSFSKAASSMWLDGVYMLPLILWGVHEAVHKKKPFFLAASVGLAIIFNWYSAGMDCMFSGIWFLLEYALYQAKTEKKAFKDFFSRLVNYGLGMFLGIGLSAVIFLPMLFQMLKATRGNADWHFLDSYFHGNLFNIVQKYSIGMSSERGALSLFCGGLMLIGVIGFFCARNVKTADKWAAGSALFIGILSCYWQPLYFIVSLFQDASSYYYRASYVCCATMLYMAGRFFAAEGLEGSFRYVWKGSAIYIAVLFALNYIKPITDDKFIYQTAAIQALLLLILLLYGYLPKGDTISDSRKLSAGILSLLLCAVTVFEMGYNAELLMDRFSYNTDLEAYRTYETEQEKLVDTVLSSDLSDYRMTQTSARAGAINQIANLDESLGFGYWAIENYISMPVDTQVNFLKKAGYVVYRSILVEKAMTLLPIESLLGVKYVLSPYPYENLTLREELGSGNGKMVYENPYYMPMAFKTDRIGDFTADYGNNAYLWQRDMFKYVFPGSGDVLVSAEYDISDEGENFRTYSINIPEGQYALYGNIPWFSESDTPWWTEEGARLDLNGRLGMSYSGINSMTNFYIPISVGDSSAYVTLNSDILDRFHEPQFYLLDLDVLESTSAMARENAPKDLVVENGYLKCTVTGTGEDSLFTSVPYFKGWSIKRNGKEISPALAENCLIVIPLEAGNNEIEMIFHTPYMEHGIAISVLSLVVLACWYLIYVGKIGLVVRKAAKKKKGKDE